MNDIRNGKVYGMLFLFFIVCLIVGGFFLMEFFTSSPKKQVKEPPKEVALEEDLKNNKKEDYIYFEDPLIKSELYGINYQNVKINLDSSSARATEIKLNEEMELLKETYKEIKDIDLEEDTLKEIIYKESGIYEAKYAKYTRYFYQNYASLLKDNYSFNCFDGEQYLNSNSYVFDTKTGEIITNEELFALYDLNLDKIKEQIKQKLENKQSTITIKETNEDNEEEKEVEVIDINATLNNLDNIENYAVFIDKGGFLNISYLVKSVEKDYNDVIIIN